jgi:hypothetical protein
MVPTDIRYDGAMFELGQKRKSVRFNAPSALPPREPTSPDSSACPKSAMGDIAGSA